MKLYFLYVFFGHIIIIPDIIGVGVIFTEPRQRAAKQLSAAAYIRSSSGV